MQAEKRDSPVDAHLSDLHASFTLCHSERSEESLVGYMQILRFAQNDRAS